MADSYLAIIAIQLPSYPAHNTPRRATQLGTQLSSLGYLKHAISMGMPSGGVRALSRWSRYGPSRGPGSRLLLVRLRYPHLPSRGPGSRPPSPPPPPPQPRPPPAPECTAPTRGPSALVCGFPGLVRVASLRGFHGGRRSTTMCLLLHGLEASHASMEGLPWCRLSYTRLHS